jgi:hypothetical protein
MRRVPARIDFLLPKCAASQIDNRQRLNGRPSVKEQHALLSAIRCSAALRLVVSRLAAGLITLDARPFVSTKLQRNGIVMPEQLSDGT